MRTALGTLLPPGTTWGDAPAIPSPRFACVAPPPDPFETGSAMVLAAAAVFHAAFILTMLVVVLARCVAPSPRLPAAAKLTTRERITRRLAGIGARRDVPERSPSRAPLPWKSTVLRTRRLVTQRRALARRPPGRRERRRAWEGIGGLLLENSARSDAASRRC